MTANYTSTTHNHLDIYFYRTTNDLPNACYSTSKNNVRISMSWYKSSGGHFYTQDPNDEQVYIKFDHISTDYVEETSSFKMVQADSGTTNITAPIKLSN